MSIIKQATPLGPMIITNPSDNPDGYTLTIRNRNSDGPTVFIDSSTSDGYGVEFIDDGYIAAPRGILTIASSGVLRFKDDMAGTLTLSDILSESERFRPSKTYFVAENGSDSNTGGSQDPFATIQKAIDTASAFETVFIYSGTYVQGTLIMKDFVSLVGEHAGLATIIFNSGGIVPAANMTWVNLVFSNVQSGGLSIGASLTLRRTGLTEVGGNPGLTIPPGASVDIDENTSVGNTGGSPAVELTGGTLNCRGKIFGVGGGPAYSQTSGTSLICQAVIKSAVGSFTAEIAGGTAEIHNSLVRNTGAGGSLLVSGGTIRLGSNDFRTSGAGLELSQTGGILTVAHDAFDSAKASFSAGTLTKLADADFILNFSGPFDGYSVRESLTQLNEPSTVNYVGDGYNNILDGSFKIEARDEIILEVPNDSYTTFEGYGLKFQDGPYGITKDGYAVLKNIHLVGSTISSDGTLKFKGTGGIDVDSGINFNHTLINRAKEKTKIICINDIINAEMTTITFDSYSNTGDGDYFILEDPTPIVNAVWLNKTGSSPAPTGADFLAADNTFEINISGEVSPLDIENKVLADLGDGFFGLLIPNYLGIGNGNGSIEFESTLFDATVDARVHNANDTTNGSIAFSILTQGTRGLDGKYFTINTAENTVKNYVWIDIDGNGNDPLPGGGLIGIGVGAVQSDFAAAIAIALKATLDANGYSASIPTPGTVEVENVAIGNTIDTADVNTGFTISTLVQGATSSNTSDGASLIAVNTAGGSTTVTIQSIDIVVGRIIEIKDISGNAATNNINIVTEGSETIDKKTSATITENFGAVRLFSDGLNLFDLNKVATKPFNNLGSVSGTVNIDWAISDFVSIDIGINSVSFTHSNVPNVGSLKMLVKRSGSAGNVVFDAFTLTPTVSVVSPSGIPPSIIGASNTHGLFEISVFGTIATVDKIDDFNSTE